MGEAVAFGADAPVVGAAAGGVAEAPPVEDPVSFAECAVPLAVDGAGAEAGAAPVAEAAFGADTPAAGAAIAFATAGEASVLAADALPVEDVVPEADDGAGAAAAGAAPVDGTAGDPPCGKD